MQRRRATCSALAWAALTEENTVLRGGMTLNRARNAGRDAQGAVRDFTAPQQNVVSPIARGTSDSWRPRACPFAARTTRAHGPRSGAGLGCEVRLAGVPSLRADARDRSTRRAERSSRANHKITPPGYKPFMSVDWFPPYRADRIEELLAQTPKHSMKSFARMQADINSRLARELLPVALAAKPATDDGADAQEVPEGLEGRREHGLAGAARLLGLVSRAHAPRLRRRAGRHVHRIAWDLRAAFMIQVMKAQNGYETLVRRRAHAGEGDMRDAVGQGVSNLAAGVSREALRKAQPMALGSHPRGGRRSPSVQLRARSSRDSSASRPRPRATASRWTWGTSSSATRSARSPTGTRPACGRSTTSRTSSDRSSSTRPASRAISSRRGIRTWPSAGRRVEYVTIPTRARRSRIRSGWS